MPLTITGDLILSDCIVRTARLVLVPGRPHAGHMSRLPGRPLDGGSDVAMTMADATASGPCSGHRIWQHIANQTVELDRTVPQAITIATRAPETASGTEPAVSPPGREVAGP